MFNKVSTPLHVVVTQIAVTAVHWLKNQNIICDLQNELMTLSDLLMSFRLLYIFMLYYNYYTNCSIISVQ